MRALMMRMALDTGVVPDLRAPFFLSILVCALCAYILSINILSAGKVVVGSRSPILRNNCSDRSIAY